jgi:hypothetical protein
MEVLFRTHCENEKKTGCCVLQLSTCDAVTALRAAEKFEKDVSSIDINMVVLMMSSTLPSRETIHITFHQ